MVKVTDLFGDSYALKLPKGTLMLNHVPLEDVVALFKKHKEAFVKAFASKGDSDFTSVLTESPMMCAEIICIAGDIRGQEEDIRKRMPPAAQIVALAEIWRLSVPDPKALWSALMDLAKEVNEASLPGTDPSSARQTSSSSKLPAASIDSLPQATASEKSVATA